MATTTARIPRAVKPGKTVVTADDMQLGSITKVTSTYVYTAGGRVPLDSYLETWTVV